MRVIDPVTITDAMLVSSTISEPDTGEVAWNAATAYVVDDIVYRASLHRRYRRLVDGTTSTAPENDSTNWAYIGGTNKWAMFDDTSARSIETSSPLTVVFEPGQINSMAILGIAGDTLEITITDGDGGPTVYSRTIDLDTSVVADWYAYFFEPFSTRQVVVLTDIPPYPDSRVTVTLTGTGDVSIANCIVGTVYDLGVTVYGVNAGIRDYSRKTTDETTGVVTLVRRRFAKTLRARYYVTEGAINAVHTRLESLRATPCVWLGGTDTTDIDPLTVFGYLKDFNLELQQANASYYSLEIEGMT
ncbi:MAG: hypothetical protein ACO3GP_03160 [Candidatus Limnocylindrus sp.]